MERAWVVDPKGFAGKVKNSTDPSAYQIKDCGASLECPNCHHHIDNSDISAEWPGLPAGVKFDPSDVELLQHLAGKIGFRDAKPHLYIDEFIPTLEGDGGICYTHPENLPGAKKDGTSIHFFHRTLKAYATGQRKRRKIHNGSSSTSNNVRWHKTGKTKKVIENGALKGFKKIMVLYKSSKKGCRPDKSNWVIHQYHLGTKEDESDDEFVVSKIFYQQQSKDKKDVDTGGIEEPVLINRPPTTPTTFTPNPPRRGNKRSLVDDIDEESSFLDQTDEDYIYSSAIQMEGPKLEVSHPSGASIDFQDPQGEQAWFAGESQPLDLDNDMDSFLYCNEILESSACVGDFNLQTNCNENEFFKGETSAAANTDDGITDYSLFFQSQDLLDSLDWMN